MKRLLTMAVGLGVVSLILILSIGSCASEDRAAAQRANAEAALEMARGQAYAERTRADAAAQAERASTRQMERDAAHQRALEVLPYVLTVVGLLLVVGLAVWLLAFRVVASSQGETALLYHLERLQLAQAEERRQLWRAIAQVSRQSLADVDSGREVVVYRENR